MWTKDCAWKEIYLNYSKKKIFKKNAVIGKNKYQPHHTPACPAVFYPFYTSAIRQWCFIINEQISICEYLLQQ